MTVWSPQVSHVFHWLSASLTLGSMMSEISLSICEQGRIHQIEYAMEAVKQGSATVGLKSRTHAVLVALKVQSCSVWWWSYDIAVFFMPWINSRKLVTIQALFLMQKNKSVGLYFFNTLSPSIYTIILLSWIFCGSVVCFWVSLNILKGFHLCHPAYLSYL